jgi:hypothetical protein
VGAPELARVEELPVRVVHPLEHVGEPADTRLGHDDLEPGVALERPEKITAASGSSIWSVAHATRTPMLPGSLKRGPLSTTVRSPPPR